MGLAYTLQPSRRQGIQALDLDPAPRCRDLSGLRRSRKQAAWSQSLSRREECQDSHCLLNRGGLLSYGW
jgi:hypothetical protein